MKFFTPEVAWHNRDPVYSVDIQPQLQKGENGSQDWYRVATSGADSVIIIWKIEQPKDGSKPSRIDQNNVLSQLLRHEKAVNVVRFIPTGDEILASADVDGTILVWKKGEIDRFTADFETMTNGRNTSPKNKTNGTDEGASDEAMAEDSAFEQSIQNVENWNQHKVLRGHLEDVVDISWSSDGLFLVSGSVDNEAIVWDVVKGTKIHMLSGHKSWVQGVSWDPLGQFLATVSADRSLRIFSAQTKKIMFRVEKGSLLHGDEVLKTKLFYDYTLQSFTRRLSFSPAGEFLLVPSGVLEFPRPEKPKMMTGEDVVDISEDPVPVPEVEMNYINTCHLFLRNNLQKPIAYFPTQDKFCHAVRFCPTRFRLREGAENPFPFPYRIIFAIATQNSVLLYDTQLLRPFAFISEVHYARISDIAWSADGCLLMISSTDGFCTFVSFAPDELGEVYEGEPFTFEPLCVSPGKAEEVPEEENPDAVTNASSAKAAKAAPEPIIKTPSVVSFFPKVSREIRLESMKKELQELDSTPKRNKRKEIIEVVLDEPSDHKKSRGDKDAVTPSQSTPTACASASHGPTAMMSALKTRNLGDELQRLSVETGSKKEGMEIDSLAATIDSVAKGHHHLSSPQAPQHNSEDAAQCNSPAPSNGATVKSDENEKKPRRINLITLMKPKSKEPAFI